MAMNPQNVLSQLRMMSDQQLQQYAAMHKNDPFIFPLAFQESQTRKQMRSESQAMQAGPQEKVADQALAAMAPEPLPEEVGIGALPAQNLEGMAAGGIVAFDEGGEVPRFNGLGGSFIGPQYSMQAFLKQLGITPQEFLASEPAAQKSIREMFSATQSATQAVPQAAPAAAQAATKPATFFESLKQGLGRLRPAGLAGWGLGAYQAELNPNEEAELAKRWKGAAFGHVPLDATDTSLGNVPSPPVVGSAGPDGQGGVGARDQGGKKLPPGPTDGTGMRPGGGLGLTAIPALTQTGTGTMAELQAMREQMGGPALTYAQQQAIKDLETASRESKEAGLKELEADIATRGPGMTGAEKRATERGERLSKRELDLPGLAMFEAGMAMMAGESPYALVNIGKGAGLGMKSYIAGLEKLQESRDKLDESFDKIEQFRENRADMNAKEVRAAKADIRQTQVEAKRLAYDALSKNGEMDRQDVRSAFDVMQRNRATMYEVASRERLGLEQIAAQKALAGSYGQLGLFRELGGGDAAKGLGVYANVMGPEARGLQGLLAKYADPMKLMALKTTDPDLYNYVRAQLSMQMMPGVMSKPTGPVRD